MSWNLVRLRDVAAAPWRNGGGVTRELLAWPEAQAWAARMSVADIERDGPFSAYPGVERWFAVLSGRGVRLRSGAQEHELTVDSAPWCFDGGEPPDCELLAGPTRDFNLMLRHAEGRLERVKGRHVASPDAGTLAAFFASQHEAFISSDGERLAVPPGTLAWRILHSRQPLELESQDALWMEITA